MAPNSACRLGHDNRSAGAEIRDSASRADIRLIRGKSGVDQALADALATMGVTDGRALRVQLGLL